MPAAPKGPAPGKATSLNKGTAPAVDINDANLPALPYVAEVTGNDVYLRSGPGTNYYQCGKLNKTTRVTVVARQFSWSCIVPPPGSFSWVSKQYVVPEANDPNTGSVTGENVRIWAGSDDFKPIHSTTLQAKLNKGDKVKLLGEEAGDYYKIAPPPGAYLWASSEYLRPLGPAGIIPIIAMDSNIPGRPATAVTVIQPSTESVKLKEYYFLQKQIDAERAKPVDQQDYTVAKKALEGITAVKDAGKAARYAKFTLNQIEKFELAKTVSEQIRQQDDYLQQVRQKIEQAKAEKMAQVPALGKFAVIGQLQTSNIYGDSAATKHYRIVDDSGKTICYAVPDGAAAGMDLSSFIASRVGLIGTIEPNASTGGALVTFTEIVKLN